MRQNNMADNDVDLDSDRETEMETQNDEHSAEEIERLLREADISDIPDTLIIANVPDSVFEAENAKEEFEKTFAVYDENVTFQYFKSFRRARANFSSPLFSANARIDLHEADVLGQRIKCYFFQPITLGGDDNPHLQLPAPHKQYLISPPASPPVDWEPCFEKKPVINYDLLAALAQLAPEAAEDKQQEVPPTASTSAESIPPAPVVCTSEAAEDKQQEVPPTASTSAESIPPAPVVCTSGQAHEIHPPSKDQPGIVVHICEDPEGYTPGGRIPIQQTRCPERKS